MTSKTPPNPTDLLAMQVKLLQSISESQHRIEKALEATQKQQNESANRSVEVVNFNMPFVSLIGMLIKLALASIPAGIILWLIYGLVGYVAFMLLTHGRGIMGLFAR